MAVAEKRIQSARCVQAVNTSSGEPDKVGAREAVELGEFAFLLFLGSALVVSFRHPKIAAAVVVALSIGSFHKNFTGISANFPWILVFLTPLANTVLGGSLDQVKDVIRQTKLVWIFFGFTLISTAVALDFSVSWFRCWELAKLLISMTIVFTVMRTRRDVEALVSVMALSMAVYGCVIGPYLMLQSSDRIEGPEDSLFGDNNSLAAALVTTVPLLYWLAGTMQKRWSRSLMYLAVLVSCVTIIGTYSRGGFLALAVMLLLLSAASRSKWMILALGLVLVGVVFYLLPEDIIERIDTIKHFRDDDSALERFAAWKNALAVALDRPFGGGFEYQKNEENFALYSMSKPRAAHSIYFQALGDHGFLGLALFLYLLGETLVIIAGTALESRQLADPQLQLLAFSLMVSLCSFMVAGAFLSLAYWDGLFFLIFAVRMLASSNNATPVALTSAANARRVVR